GDASKSFRVATFNTSLNRRNEGDLLEHMKLGSHPQIRFIAETIQRIRPDVLLVNEFDYDTNHESLKLFQEKYLGVDQRGEQAIQYPYTYSAAVNTGVASGLDLDGNGSKGPADAFGFGFFPGQYGMVVLSKYPIQQSKIRTFQTFLWRDMPKAELPVKTDGTAYYSAEVLARFRLSSKSHWDVPIEVDGKVFHFLTCHPTPPVFDGSEDRNGCRNSDEIRFFADYIVPSRSNYIYDDKKQKGGLAAGEQFVIAGDMNADPYDGESRENPIRQLLKHERVNATAPKSEGAVEQTKKQGRVNADHHGDPAEDTADFNDAKIGNLRLDYVLPSDGFSIVSEGTFWPRGDDPAEELVHVSDHRLVWVDLRWKVSE
ncbi:MAG: endonuclease/exonuclease/phosphatase family metal-dependent hydrolase, partial [Pirellulaceae bacterium]